MAALAPELGTVPLMDDMGVQPLNRVPSMMEEVAIQDKASPASLPELEVDDKVLKEISLWIGEELNLAKSERQEVEEKWKLIQVMYEMVELPDKDFPFPDSAHLVIPIIATFTETVWAKIVNTIFAPADPFKTRSLRTDLMEVAKALRKFITWSAKEELDLENVCSSLFLELVKLGTCVAKVVYTVEERVAFEYDPKLRKYTKTTIRLKDNPELIHVPLPDFFYRLAARSQNDCTWKSHRVLLSWGEILRRKASGMFKAEYVDEFLMGWKSGKVKRFKKEPELKTSAAPQAYRTPYEQARDEVSGEAPLTNDEFEFHEMWFEYMVPKEDKLPIKLVAWYEPNSGNIFRIQHNWFPLQGDPFELCAYIPREHRIYGMGVGLMAMPFQNEITAMHNQRLDAATVANANVTFVKDDSTLPLNFRVKPGGTYAVSDPNEVNIKPLGQKYDSTISEEQHTMSLIQQRIGIQDYINQQLGQTSTQAIMNMQESTRKFDIVIRNIRRFMTRIIQKSLLLQQLYYPDKKPSQILGDEDGQYIDQMFLLPQKLIKYGIIVQVTATTSTTSKELERQTKLSLFNMMTQYYGQLTQYITGAANPQMPPMVQQTMLAIVEALGVLVRSILEDFDVAERERLIIDDEARPAIAADAAGVGPGGVPGNGANPGAAVAPGPAGSGGVPSDALQQQLASISQLLSTQAASGRA